MPTTRTRATPTPTQKTRASALARTLDPVSGEEFLAEYWEQKPLAVPRGERGRFDDLLSVLDVERLLTSGGLRFPGFRLAKAGAKVDVADYTKDLSWRPQPFSGSADVQVLGTDRLRIYGEQVIDIRDFAISLPATLMLRIYPDVTVRFRIEAVRGG